MVACLWASAAPVVASADPTVWSPPVEVEPERGFAPGLGDYHAGGHLGVDYPAGTGAEVRAAGAGVVSFAGSVAGARFVVVRHGDDLRTSYGPLEGVTVRRGEAVERGDALGTVGAGLDGHEPGSLHFGLRSGSAYLDPLTLFAPPDLTRIVRLVPADDLDALLLPPPGVEAVPLWRQFSDEPLPWWFDGDGGNRFGSVAGAVAGLSGTLSGLVGGGARFGLERLSAGIQILPFSGVYGTVLAAQLLVETRRAYRDWRRLARDCTEDYPSSAGFTGSGNHLFAVAGLNSETKPDGSTLGLPRARLGYGPGEVTYYSYSADGDRYGPEATHVGPRVAAERLARQLRRFARTRPGVAVDLVGHSQGAVVVESFLKLHYAPDPHAYPPLGRVVTLAGPHRGSHLARLSDRLVERAVTHAAAEILDELAGSIPDPDSGSAQELGEHSRFMETLRDLPLPSGVAVTTIGGAGDWVVTADSTRLEGARNVVIDPDVPGSSDHSGILTDDQAVGEMRLALSGAPPRCRGLGEMVGFRVQPHLIRAVQASLFALPAGLPLA